jgi:hypothetical protein
MSKKDICPKCGYKLPVSRYGEMRNYCVECKIAICPTCGDTQPYESGASLELAIVTGLMLPFIIITMLFMDDFWSFSDYKTCNKCKNKFEL